MPQGTTAVSKSLEARLDHLKQSPTRSAETTRNPLNFYAKPAPKVVLNARRSLPPTPSDPGDKLLPAPAIAIKFIGVAQQGTTKVAIFSDGKGLPV